MPLNYQVLFFMLLLVCVYASMSARGLKDKIWCTFRRRDRTKLEKWAKQNQGDVVFAGGKYHIDPSRTTLMLWTKGIHFFLPIWIRSLDFRHDSPNALNPDTFDNSFTPEDRVDLDTRDEIKAFNQGNTQNTAKQKKGLLENLFPILVIVGFIIVGYMLYIQGKRMDMIGIGQNVIEQGLQQLLGR